MDTGTDVLGLGLAFTELLRKSELWIPEHVRQPSTNTIVAPVSCQRPGLR